MFFFLFLTQPILFVNLTSNLCLQAYHLVILYCVHTREKSITILCIHHKCVSKRKPNSMGMLTKKHACKQNEQQFLKTICWHLKRKENKIKSFVSIECLASFFVVVDRLSSVDVWLEQIEWKDKNNVCMSIHDILCDECCCSFFFVLFIYFLHVIPSFLRILIACLKKKYFTSVPVKIGRIHDDWCTQGS